jgi:TPR repeat protein
MSHFRDVAALLLSCMLLGACATQSETQSAYNSGVAAYRAKDYATARVEWRTSAASGTVDAMNNLGYLLSQGLGGERDEPAAVDLWTTAAKQGEPEAAWHLGQAYQYGNGVPRSEIEAYAWYRCAVASSRAAGPDQELDAEILKDANDSLSKLMAEFPSEKFQAAQELAGRYVATYAKK